MRRIVTWCVCVVLAGCGAGRDAQPQPATTTPKAAQDDLWVNPFGAAIRAPWDATVDGAVAGAADARALDAAQAAFDDGLYDQARSQADALSARGVTHAQLSLLHARLRMQAGDAAAAVPWCERAIAASPRWPAPRVLMAQAYLELKRPAAAQSVFAELERYAPWSPWGAYGQGAIALQRGLADDARDAVRRALAIDGRHPPSLALAAALARMANDTASEESLLVRLVEEQPQHAPTVARLAALALAGGRSGDARRLFERAWSLEPDATIARQLAELARRRGDAAEERRWLDAAGAP